MCTILGRRSPSPVLRHNIDGLLSCQPQAVEMIRFGYIVFRVRVVEAAAVDFAEAYPYVVEGGVLGGGRQREFVAAQGGDVVGGGDGGLLGGERCIQFGLCWQLI